MVGNRLGRRSFLVTVTGTATAVAGCSGSESASSPSGEPTTSDTDAPSTDDADSTATGTATATFEVEAEVRSRSVEGGGELRVAVTVTNTGGSSGETTLTLTGADRQVASETVALSAGGERTVELVGAAPPEPGSITLAVNGEPVGEVTVERIDTHHVAPDGDDGNSGLPDEPLASIDAALEAARPGDTVVLAPGEYRELVRTERSGEPDAPITIEGPPEAVIRPPEGVNDAVLIEHSHVHVRGMTIDGLVDPERKFERYQAWIPQCVNISPLRRRDEGVEYLRDIVVEPSRLGNGARALIQVERVRDASIGNFEVIGPAGMQFDPRVDNHEVGHIREIVYVGSPEVHRGEDYYGYETLDRSRNIRIHHIDNSAGYRHNELVDVKLGSTDITVEYCTDRNAGHNSEGVVSAAIDLKGNDCTVRWNDIGECPLPLSFGAWAPSDDIDGGDWSRNNAVYGNRIHDFAAGPIRLRDEGDIGPVSFEDQRVLCGNEIDRGSLDPSPWVGDANGFDGVTDRRGNAEVTVTVGAGPDGYALDPAAVLVDRGTTVTWEWADTGGEHYVVERHRTEAPPASVPDVRPAPYSESTTFDQVGMTRYACYAHHERGMRGAVIVDDGADRHAFATEDCDGDLPEGDGVGHTGGSET